MRDLQVEHWPEQTRVNLPVRPLGKFRWIGLLPIGFGVLFAALPGGELARLALKLMAGKAGGFEALFAVFLSFFVFAGLMPIGIGLLIIAGRTRLRITRERLVITEIAGPFGWSRRIRLENIERLHVATSDPKTPAQVATPLFGLSALSARMKNGKTLAIAMGYPRDLLDRAAAEIITATLPTGRQLVLEDKIWEPEGKEPEVPPTTPSSAERPAQTDIVEEVQPDGLHFTVPARGLFKGSYSLFPIGLVWSGITGFMVFMAGFQNARKGGFSDALTGAFISLIFGSLGILLLLIGLHLGTRRWKILAGPGSLRVHLSSLLRRRQWEWIRDDLELVQVGDSRTKVNNQTLYQLQIKTRMGKTTGLLTGRSIQELEWLASKFNATLRLSPASGKGMLELKQNVEDFRP